ncbi:uncharacterized protein EI97DRAFT_413028 [Westerdykella ornata]|uniref:Mediator of RNA polymerase II transcription subunit 13 n=1 Tax=Westerdykella ornata TaxID=318751 RepID=A0A6A6JU39_WESOR|nr:uncharacterized protein EI97DRAFT_413028 [Westerdykella ornata]KAF2279744.1 hypothetical protein EI97DRAFT_413028 [Westerdykella ornata]
MEFLKSCNTSVQSIAGFEIVSYQAFSVSRIGTLPPRNPTDTLPFEDVSAVEAEFRQRKQLVIQDRGTRPRPWLWIFEATSPEKTAGSPPEPPKVEGYELKREQSGVVKAGELARPPNRRPPIQNPSASVSANTPSTPASQRAPPPAPTPQLQANDVFTLYELFTASVIALISYHWVKHQQAVALNFRTFVCKPPYYGQDSRDNTGFGGHSVFLTDLSVYWASNGTVLVSSVCVPYQTAIRCLDGFSESPLQEKVLNKCVRIAPNGWLARVVSFEDPVLMSTGDSSTRSRRKRIKVGLLESSVDKWKAQLARWLCWKGYSTSGLDGKDAWVRIRLLQTPTNYVGDIYWPRALCFLYDSTILPESRVGWPTNRPDDPLLWFANSQTTGFKDPIDAAEEWFLGKAERDKAEEARRLATKAQEEAAAARLKEDMPGGLFPSSPNHPRTVPYGELQSAAGVYPTPPDGVVPGTAVTQGDTPTISGTATSKVLAPAGITPGINVSAPSEGPRPNGQQDSQNAPDEHPGYEGLDAGENDDDLFNDMDEDDFGGNGVTDADFSFFDGPDHGEVGEMADAGAGKGGGVDTSKEARVEDTPSFKALADEKEDQTDPMAALESALTSASNLPLHQKQYVKMEETGDKEVANGTMAMEVDSVPSRHIGTSEPITIEELEPEAKDSRDRRGPLSAKQQAALSSTAGRQHAVHPHSVFQPITFGREAAESDLKYFEGRFKFPKEKLRAGKNMGKRVGKGPAPSTSVPSISELRVAAGLSPGAGIEAVSADSEFDETSSDSASVTSSTSEEAEEKASVSEAALSAGPFGTMKRKFPGDGNATPMSATSFASSVFGDALDVLGVTTDKRVIPSLEPDRWDWSLTDAPPPTQVSSKGHNNVGTAATSTPGTPASIPDLSTSEAEYEEPLSGSDSIAVAQVLTDQVVATTLNLFQNGSPIVQHDSKPLTAGLRHSIRDIFPKAQDCSLAGLASVAEIYPEPPPSAHTQQQRASGRRPNDGATFGCHFVRMQPPYIRVKRSDASWEFLPPALNFWEILGLAPCSSSKNVGAICVYPDSDPLKPWLEHFLLNLRIAYEGQKLGNHETVECSEDHPRGLVPWSVPTQATSRAAFRSLRETCKALGTALAAKHADMQNGEDMPRIDAFVIYIVNPFKNSSALWELCSAFWSLFQAYSHGSSARMEMGLKPDVVLQIVPMEYIASFEIPVILDATVYASLAREVYDRCPPSSPSDEKLPLSIYAAPAFHLEECLPRQIDFRTVADPPPDLLRENSYMHIGYAKSFDDSWMTAAWTDSCGRSRTVVSYHIGRRSFIEIAREVWQTTVEICQARKIKWRLCIAKHGAMEKEEIEAWYFLAATQNKVVNFFTILLTVEPNLPLKCVPTMAYPSGQNSNAQAPAGTPASTPQAGVSPDGHNLTPAATPAAEPAIDPANDPDARLVDVTDESWGVILAHRLHSCHSTVEFRPSLVSGLLIKRGLPHETSPPPPSVPDPEVGPIVVGVNMIWITTVGNRTAPISPFPTPTDGVSPGGSQGPLGTGGPSSENQNRMSLIWTPTPQHRASVENLMKDILTQFRGLGTLARLKGVRGNRMGTVPWHVAVAKTGVEGVARCFPRGYGGGG